VSAPSYGHFPPGESPFRVKGVTYRNFFDLVDERIAGGRAALLAELRTPPWLRSFAEQSFLPSTLYDALPWVLLCQAAATMLGVTSDEFVRQLSR
jgi:hypothetical protein